VDPKASTSGAAASNFTSLDDRRGRPLKDLRISVMDRCNFRCPYCMPENQYHRDFQFLHADERLSFPEISRLARLFVERGVTKLRLTGGEPLLRPGLVDLIGELSLIEGVEDLALTTNGILLAQHAAALKGAGLDRVTVSLDALDEATFRRMSGGRGTPERVLEGIDAAIEAGLMRPEDQYRRAARARMSVEFMHCWSVSGTPAWSCVSSSTWMSARSTSGTRRSSCLRPNSSRTSASAGPSGRWKRATAERWPNAGSSRMAAARSVSSAP
jgi:hypothetical protein